MSFDDTTSASTTRFHPLSLVRPDGLKVACSACNLRELCLPIGLDAQDMAHLEHLISEKRTLHRGERLFQVGAAFQAVYAIRTGFFKTCTTSESGREQVTGFQMAGELLGLDGISQDHHTVDAIALEDSQVCVLTYAQLERLMVEVPPLMHQFHKIMSREIVHDHDTMLLLGSMRAEERVAAFLLNLVHRLQARGFSPSALVLRMTREEIGSYLGLKLETVSRTFSKFQEDGLLDVRQRQITLRDPAALQRVQHRPSGAH